jgi:hypothetical protein
MSKLDDHVLAARRPLEKPHLPELPRDYLCTERRTEHRETPVIGSAATTHNRIPGLRGRLHQARQVLHGRSPQETFHSMGSVLFEGIGDMLVEGEHRRLGPTH